MNERSASRLRWGLAAAGSIGLLAILAGLARLPPPPADRPESGVAGGRPPVVQLARRVASDAVLSQETEIRDLRPLFLPTPRNVSLPEPRREPGRTFLDNETLRLGFGEADFQVGRGFPPIAAINGRPAQEAVATDALMAEGDTVALRGFGRSPVQVAVLPVRGGFISVVTLRTGLEVLAEALPAEASPPGGKSWEPLELLAAVDVAGLAAPLVITTSSRVENVDAHFRDFLARTFRIGARLPPGFYRIVVGP